MMGGVYTIGAPVFNDRPVFGYTPGGMRNALLLAVYFLFVTAANTFLKLSADAASPVPFLAFQAAGNLAGFVGVLAYTGLMRTLPLHIAFPLTQGFAVLGVQLFASLAIFHEAFTPAEAAGSVMVAAGIALVGAAAPRRGGAGGGGGGGTPAPGEAG